MTTSVTDKTVDAAMEAYWKACGDEGNATGMRAVLKAALCSQGKVVSGIAELTAQVDRYKAALEKIASARTNGLPKVHTSETPTIARNALKDGM